MSRDWIKVCIAVLAISCAVLAAGGEAIAAVARARSGGVPDLARVLGALESQSFAAWKSGDRGFWATYLSDDFVGWGPSGRLDKDSAVLALSGAGCRISNYRLSNEQMSRLTPNAALLTHKSEVNGVCGGKPLAPTVYTATVYVREGGQWRAGFRAQSAVVDPLKATIPAASGVWTDGPTRSDADTQALLAREQAMVEAWKNRDAARMDRFFGPSIQFVDIFGNHIGSRAEALKKWSGEGCDVKGFKFSGAKATMLAPDFGVLTYRAVYDGKCFGQELWPIWGTAFYVKRGAVWMWSSGINVLAGASR
ncbi:MAG: nuclear transport factor 2 family protein [Steroidobacteraceae bacterium]|nr:nuclear transport factor 2 family protein [Pseudomonadota bacterium]